MKPSVCCVVLFLLFHCAAPKSLPSESETTTTAADEEITTVAEVNATVGEASTTLSSSTASASTVAPSPPAATPSSVVSSYSPMQNLIKNVGYAFRIVMKLLAPLFATPQNQKPADAVSEYEDFDEIPTDEDDEASRQAALANSFVRTVRQVAEQGRQGGISGYYDFIVNEYSYKFWAVYMLLASALLTYSAIAAIYYAKFNTGAIDYAQYDEARAGDDSVFSRPGTNPLGIIGSLVSVQTFQNIMDAISSTKFDQSDEKKLS